MCNVSPREPPHNHNYTQNPKYGGEFPPRMMYDVRIRKEGVKQSIGITSDMSDESNALKYYRVARMLITIVAKAALQNISR